MSDFDPKAEIERMGVSFHDLDAFLLFINSHCELAARVTVCGAPQSGKTTLISFLKLARWKWCPEINEVLLSRRVGRENDVTDAQELTCRFPRGQDFYMADLVLMTRRKKREIWVSLEKCRWVRVRNLVQAEWRIR